MTDGNHPAPERSRLFGLTLAAVGVVYGDIGTSPLYALRECFHGSHSVPPTAANVLGVLSLIFYALLFVVTLKYVVIVLRADNRGEGGILALTALLPAQRDSGRAGWLGARPRRVLVLFGILGAALLYGDGMITPAITVLGAVEGLEVATPAFEPYVVAISVGILVGIFTIQRYGTARIGRFYGPVMVIWFVTLAVLGVRGILLAPAVLDGFHPEHAIRFLSENGWHGFAVLGAVVLVTTGAESLYADLGHFGRRPIRFAWFGLVLPSLLLNYFGQGALLLVEGDASQPFFQLAPEWALLPLVGISTIAAIIASQALISGVFSLTRSAVQLGYAPRVQIAHTSSLEHGQIYVPAVNRFLAISTIAIVLLFQSSGALAAAYGIAVTMTMVCTALLLQVIARERWKWSLPLVAIMGAAFLVVDMAFFAANVLKIQDGGWLPLIIAGVLFTLMTTWNTGRRLVASRFAGTAVALPEFIGTALTSTAHRVPGTAVFMTAHPTGTPPALAHNVRFNKVLHETVVILTVRTLGMPTVRARERLSIQPIGNGIYDVWVQYGFMEQPDVPAALVLAKEQGVPIDLDDVTYFLGRETLIATERRDMVHWRERLFVFMAKNAVRAVTFFRLPPDRVVELGVQVEL